MKFCMDELIRVLATALDAVESELVGASTNHGKRIATLTIAMGKYLGMGENELSALAGCALLHDNALTEYILSERPGTGQRMNMRLHCEYGQRNADVLPFRDSIDGYILYHHECADGSGPFGKTEGEYPRGAALIAIADMVDVQVHLQRVPPAKLPAVRAEIAAQTGRMYTRQASEALLAVLDEEMLLSLANKHILFTVAAAMPCWMVDIQDEAIVRLAGISAQIIDYKSNFTRKHSVQIANKAWLMCNYYNFSPQIRAQVYLAASLHDLGKLYTPTSILEKPGTLTDLEFEIITSHVWWTRELLQDISGLGKLCDWASNHHEKLDGTGYPNGLAADALDFISRMMACVDIYQAVTEERPYHAQRTHSEGIAILYSMAEKGQIDDGIVRGMDNAMAAYSNRDVPSPPGASV